MLCEVSLRSAPGMWARYEGTVKVRVFQADQDVYGLRGAAFRAAVRELGRTSFPDRKSMDSWVLEDVTVLRDRMED